jgi:four helix bundle protein
LAAGGRQEGDRVALPFSKLPKRCNLAITNYRDLMAWQSAMDLVESVYRLAKAFPKEEIYTLSSQRKRAAISIPSNIAEGQGRRGDREFSRFLEIAHGSLREVETQVLIAQRLQYINESTSDPVLELASKVGRLIMGLLNKINQ